MVKTSAFQADDEGSIPFTRSIFSKRCFTEVKAEFEEIQITVDTSFCKCYIRRGRHYSCDEEVVSKH